MTYSESETVRIVQSTPVGEDSIVKARAMKPPFLSFGAGVAGRVEVGEYWLAVLSDPSPVKPFGGWTLLRRLLAAPAEAAVPAAAEPAASAVA